VRSRARFVSGEEMPLAAFVNTFISDAAAASSCAAHPAASADGRWRGYLAQHAFLDRAPALAAEAPAPRYIPAGRTPLRQLWLGPGGTITPLHRDPYDNLLCQAYGTKAVRLYAAAQAPSLYAFQQPAALRNTSRCEVWDPRGGTATAAAFPAFAAAPFWEGVLAPGEALALPRGVWHAVRSLDASISLSFWWT
jgi:lysine-specific demethylase 8